MKKKITIGLTLLIALIPFLLGSCFVSKHEYEKVATENELLKNEINNLNEKIVFSSERLVDSSWDNNKLSIKFGNNSFSLKYTDSLGREQIIVGSYEVIGDYVFLTNSSGEKWDGMINGISFTISGARGISSELKQTSSGSLGWSW